ncbi:MAG: lipid A biosynthesis protein [bacterium]|nr:lipid A biosynthesis protein [bacterium]MCP5042071.1 lipid A biosynthesis protein [bacterium]
MLDWSDSAVWLMFGLLGNVTFASRFFLQWIASERAGESTIPVAFWYLSILGSLILLVYAIHLRNPVFTLAYLPNAAIYIRNLVLIHRNEEPPELAPLRE